MVKHKNLQKLNDGLKHCNEFQKNPSHFIAYLVTNPLI